MELKDFIKNTISSISEAILESQTELKEKGVIINPEKYEVTDTQTKSFGDFGRRHIQTLKFDVLVGVEAEDNNKAGGGLKVAQFINVGGEKAKKNIIENQNRISFEIPIAFSTMELPEKYKKKPITW